MFEVPVLLVLIVVVALIFDFTNGAHDCANAIATVVSTKVLSPRVAVVMAASLNFIGAFLGTKVATTLGAGIVNTDMVANCQPLVLAALLGAIAWNLITWYFGIPSSSSHALIGGLMGAAVAYAGFSTLNGASIAEKILLPLILSPLAGFGMGFLTMFLIMLLCARANRNKLTRLPDFFVGVLLYQIYQSLHNKKISSSTGTFLEVASVALFLLFYLCAADIPKVYRYSCYYWLPVSLMILIFAFQKGGISRLLSNRFLIIGGEISYSFYLIHLFIILTYTKMAALYQWQVSWMISVPLIFGITIILSLLSYYYFEKPANKWVKRILTKKQS